MKLQSLKYVTQEELLEQAKKLHADHRLAYISAFESDALHLVYHFVGRHQISLAVRISSKKAPSFQWFSPSAELFEREIHEKFKVNFGDHSKKRIFYPEKAKNKTNRESLAALNQDDSKSLSVAANALKDGLVVVAPTDTVYGMLADVADPLAVKRIYALKERNLEKPLPVFVSGKKMLWRFFEKENAKEIEEKLPGPFTFLLVPKNEFLREAAVGFERIGVRIPDEKWVCRLISMLGNPVTATSANKTGKPPATTAKKAMEYFGQGVAVYIDGGKKNKPVSTIIDASTMKKVARK